MADVFKYAISLAKENKHDAAIEKLTQTLAELKQLAKTNPDAYLPHVAMALNDLAVIQHVVGRDKEAETNYTEALGIYRKLVKANLDAYLPYMANTLDNMALLPNKTNRYKEAEDIYAELLGFDDQEFDRGKEFLEQMAHIVHKAYELGKKAKRKGLSICELNCEYAESIENIDDISPNTIDHEWDDNTRRIKMIQSEAVRTILEDNNLRLSLLLLFSHIGNSELKAVIKFLPADNDDFKDFSEDDLALMAQKERCAMGRDEFIDQLAHIVRTTYEFDKKAKTEGLLALGDDVVNQKAGPRDIFQSGMRLTVDGTDTTYIDRILSNLIAHERDERAKKIKTIQKEAVLCIQSGDSRWRFLSRAVSHIDNSELTDLQETLSDAWFYADFEIVLKVGDVIRNTESEANYLEQLKIGLDLAGTKPDMYLPYVAEILCQYLSYLRIRRRRGKSVLDNKITDEDIYLRLFIEWQSSAVTEPSLYLQCVEITLNDLFYLQMKTNQYNETQARYVNLLGILGTYRKLAETNPGIFLSKYANDYRFHGISHPNNFYESYYSTAIKNYTEAIRLDLDPALAYRLRGSVYYRQEQYDMAIKDYVEAIKLNQVSVCAYIERGDAYEMKGQHALAIKDYDEIISRHPEYARAYKKRGVLYYKKCQYDLAITDFNEAIKLGLNDASLLSNRGKAYGGKGQYALAIGDYSEAIKLDPKQASIYNQRGVVYYSQKQYEPAIKDYTEAIRLNPDDSSYYSNRGNAYKDNGQYDLAIEDFSSAIRFKPSSFSFYTDRGKTYYEKAQYDLAIKDYTEAIRLNPTNAVFYDNREEAYKKKGRYDLAAKDAAEAIKFSIAPLSDDEISKLLPTVNASDKDKGSAETADLSSAALSEAEMDALLSGGNEPHGTTGAVLSKYEIEQLLSGMNTDDKDSEKRSPRMLLKKQIEALSTIHEAFASALAARPNLPIQASVSGVDEITHEEYLRNIPESSILATISMKPLEGNAILDVDPFIAFSIADKLIGGIGERINSHKDFVNIAKHVMGKVFVHLLEDIKKAWAGVVYLQPELVRVDAGFQLVQIAPPSDKVVFAAFEAKLGDMKGTMGFCVPYTTIKPILGKLSTMTGGADHELLG